LDLIPRENRAIPIAPDVAIEVVSASEQPEDTERRLRDYLEAECEVWQIFPSLNTVTIWRGNEGKRLSDLDQITSDRLPGFAIAVSEIFSDV
jgi:Uma2 family endonuclease